MRYRPSLVLGAGMVLALAGCDNRGADDRVAVEESRQDHRGAGYTVVAFRPVDRARLANGAVIVNESGVEPVYVTEVAFRREQVEDVRARGEAMQDVLQRIEQLQQRLDRASPAAVPMLDATSQRVMREPANQQVVPEHLEARKAASIPATATQVEAAPPATATQVEAALPATVPQAEAAPVPPPAPASAQVPPRRTIITTSRGVPVTAGGQAVTSGATVQRGGQP